MRYEFGKLGEDEAGLGAGDVEGDAVVEQSDVLQGGHICRLPRCSADINTGLMLCIVPLLTLGLGFHMVDPVRH